MCQFRIRFLPRVCVDGGVEVFEDLVDDRAQQGLFVREVPVQGAGLDT